MRTAFATACVIACTATAGSLGCEDLFEGNVVVQDPRAVPIVEGTDSDPRALTEYNDTLAGYGWWSNDDTYGTEWTPSDPTFVPYATHGRFVNIDGNAVWLSELAWGPATLHHGRWVQHDGRWHWIPGLSYSSAWVQWSQDGETTFWQPTPPTLAWRNGVPYRIEPPQEPYVGSSRVETLALAPPAPIPARPPSVTATEQDDSADDFAGRWLAPAYNGW